MHSVRENQSDNNNDYQQGISLINAGNNGNQWSDKANNAGDNNNGIEFVDGDHQDSQQNQLHQPNQQNQYDQPNQEECGEGLNESRPTFSLNHSNNKQKGRKKLSSQPLTEGNFPYNQSATNTKVNANVNVNTISFSLTLAELAKLSAIATILGYEDLSLFARELVLKGLEPYFERASQAVKAEHFG